MTLPFYFEKLMIIGNMQKKQPFIIPASIGFGRWFPCSQNFRQQIAILREFMVIPLSLQFSNQVSRVRSISREANQISHDLISFLFKLIIFQEAL